MRRSLLTWAMAVSGALAGLVAVAPASWALPTPARPGLAEHGRSDAVVVPPGEADATGQVPPQLGDGAGGAAGSVTGRAGVPGAVVGSRSVIVLRVDYAGDTVDPKAAGQPYTEADIRSRLTGAPLSASSLLSAQSEGAVSLTGDANPGGDVSPWITLPGTPPVKPATATSAATCNHGKIAKDVFDGAAASGLDVTRYDHAMIVFPDYPASPTYPASGVPASPCEWSGLGEVPGHTTWINGLYAGQDDLDAAVIAHELGHNLGVAHAASVACTTAAGNTTTLVGTCALGTAVEYGDPFDLMGGGWPTDFPSSPWLGSVLMSSWHRAQLLELPVAAQQIVSVNGTYTLDDARSGTGIRLLRLPRGTGTEEVRELVIERRTGAADFDRWTGAVPPVPDGVLIRLAPSLTTPKRSLLLDMHPSTSTSKDAPLALGQTFEDRAAGITITLTALEGGRARLEVGGVRYPAATPAPTPVPTSVPVPTAVPVIAATPSPSPTVSGPTPTPVLSVEPRVALLRPSAARGRVVAADGRVSLEVSGAGRIVVTAGARTLRSVRRSQVSFTLPRALRRNGTVQVRASGGTLRSTVRATLRVKARKAKLTVTR